MLIWGCVTDTEDLSVKINLPKSTENWLLQCKIIAMNNIKIKNVRMVLNHSAC